MSRHRITGHAAPPRRTWSTTLAIAGLVLTLAAAAITAAAVLAAGAGIPPGIPGVHPDRPGRAGLRHDLPG
ncbi:MAG TPA: hypothetical protein VGG25_10220 [Streptosporangiaceae bacterium]|jgi:hypothetical protein